MLLRSLAAFALLGALPVALGAGNPVVDNSRADADGPHVFYRGKSVIVKTVERLDTNAVVRIKEYGKKEGIILTCTLPQSGDAFSFPIKDKLRVEKETYDLPERLLALSDIEGNFPALKMMLQAAQVMDDKFRWSFGKGHLVLVGDFFDRGLNVTECLWLIYKLENEAEAAGGKVHFILGNHELLNLSGEYGYVRRKYMENAALMGDDYSLWYNEHTELGRWLRTKNAVERIGDYVFCHGGISPALANTPLRLQDINILTRKFMGKPEYEINDSLARLIFDTELGIFWFRGAAKNKLSDADIENILKFAGAKRMVIGHTLVPDVMGLYDGRVVCIDLYHDENLRQGFVKTLLIENGYMYVLNTSGEKASPYVLAARSKG